MSNEILLLSLTAATLGFFHTLIGPDHYLPFIVMAKARRWSLTKTAVITLLCGVGHVASSILLGLAGIALGAAVTGLVAIESFRGNLAAWGLIAFGLLYFIWGLKRSAHTHLHHHPDGTAHSHSHRHREGHIHLHEESKGSLTPWVLFTLFVLGPCEPLIPLLMYPAAKSSLAGVVWVSLVFGAVTVATMCGLVLLLSFGLSAVRMGRLERYGHSLAGATICVSGLAIQLLGV